MPDEITPAQRAQLEAPVAGLEYVTEAIETFVIADEGDYEIAADLLAEIAGALKAIEAQRLELTRPLNEVVRRINAAAKATAGALPDASTRLRGLMSDYRSEQERVRYEAKVAAQAASGQAVVDPGSLPAAAPATVTTATGSKVGSRKRWTFEVTDAHALAKACSKSKAAWAEHGDMVMPSPTYINAAVKAGLREFPGLRIFEKSDAVVR